MYIPVTGNDDAFYSEGFVVRFYKSDGTDWVANFQPGWTDLKEIHEFANDERLLVIACGTCYMMNPDQTKPLSVFGVGYMKSFKTHDQRLILQDQIDLTIIEANGEHWDTERISIDGLKDIELKNNVLTGLSYDPRNELEDWVRFTYDIDTKILIGGSYKLYN